MSQRLLRSLILIILFSLFTGNGFSQQKQNKRSYLSTSADDWKFYYQKEIRKLENGNPSFWVKVVYLDGSPLEMFQEWDCSQNRYRHLQTNAYSPTDKTLDGDKNLDWTYTSPESISSITFSVICEQATLVSLVEVISLQANFCLLPNKNAAILKTAKKGSRFILSLAEPIGGWYNVVDEKTQNDHWIHGNAIRIAPVGNE